MHERFLRGFTIVELLIVIAVIGILAAITTVAYNGVTARANDTTVTTDVTKFSDAINVYYSQKNTYPLTQTDITTIDFSKFSRASYITTQNAVAYCVGGTPNGQSMVLIGTSKTNKSFYALNEDSVKQSATTMTTANASSLCSTLGVTTPTLIWLHSTSTGWLYSV